MTSVRLTVSLVVVAVLATTTSSRGYAALAHGIVDLFWGGFDFSEQKSYPPPATDYPVDIGYVIIVEPPLGPRLTAWRGYILAVPGVLVEGITTAPTDAGVYHQDEVPVYNRAYIFKTEDGFYAKFAVRSEYLYEMIIEYWVQMDGTNNLADPTPTQATT